jgi:hypothetical protein
VSEYAEFDDEERMTYAPVRTQAQELSTAWRQVAELQAERDDAATKLGEALLREARLQRELEETRCVRNDRFVARGEYTSVRVERDKLQAKLDAVPLAALRFIASAPCRQWDRAESDQAWNQLEAWLKAQPEGAYQGVQNAG